MLELVNFEPCPDSGRFYGGDAGRKVGVSWNGDDWMLKFPGPTKELTGSVPSYTSAPLSEFLGSQIYAMHGIDVHETKLGIREGKLVCACKDFEANHGRLVEFRELKNSMSDDEAGFSGSPSDGRNVVLADVRATIYRHPWLNRIPGAIERFWDMFIIDSFIRNVDRNNTNWGILINGEHTSLAPVYDNGSSLYNKRTPKQIHEHLHNENLLNQDILDVRSCYLDDRGHHIAPLKYIASLQDEECNNALVRFVNSYDQTRLDALFDSLPNEYAGIHVADDEYREYHKRILTQRYEQMLLPTYRKIIAAS
ncbi:HipA domain-containing protein [Bifidobacterium sp. ESL0800]|uniref:HipA domain-containing protein n=1 Tax=Bifidobacterium sp. ESL0800 TaxID=2983236 RepID=UPI0023F9FD9B|nr:HipA domain-containing protein [Bifidobacterium sp. ESL0800]WEV75271.1 HipA domain-containing protein [Bifidobacterium sp. ESL0800]